MTISMDQLEAFVSAADTGSFSAAGRALRKAQSAVSTQVSNLETDLGVTLFSRAGRNPTLTAAGERLLAEARLILDRREHLIGIAASFEAHVEKRLVVAIDEQGGMYTHCLDMSLSVAQRVELLRQHRTMLKTILGESSEPREAP